MNKTFRLYLIFIVALFSKQTFAQTLQSHAEVQITGSSFAYTIFNDEAVGTDLFLYGFTLIAHAPFDVTQTPVNWEYTTDNLTYIDWINEDPNFPSNYDVAPGASLAGFVLNATIPVEAILQPYTIQASDHTTGNNGSITDPSVQVLSPSMLPVLTPEPSSEAFLGIMTLSFGGLLLRAWRRYGHSKNFSYREIS